MAMENPPFEDIFPIGKGGIKSPIMFFCIHLIAEPEDFGQPILGEGKTADVAFSWMVSTVEPSPNGEFL